MPAKPYNLDMTGSMPRPLTGPSARTSSPARYYSQEIPASFDPHSKSHNTIESPSRSQGPYATVPSSTYAPGSHSTTYDDEKNAAFDDYDRHSLASPRRGWGSRRKVIIAAIIAAVLILAIALGLGLGLGLNKSSPYDFTLSNATCTNETSFTQGGASRQAVSNVADGIGAGQDTYTYYSGPSENFPPSTSWISLRTYGPAIITSSKQAVVWYTARRTIRTRISRRSMTRYKTAPTRLLSTIGSFWR